jgi:tol-pal system protein YbgF
MSHSLDNARWALLVPVLLLASCVTTPAEDDPLVIKMEDIDQRVGRVERVVNNQSLVELSQRIDTLQNELRTLRGQVEELENDNAALRKQQRELYADLDRRIGGASAGGGANSPPVNALGVGVSAGTLGGSADAASADPGQPLYNRAFDALKGGNYANAIQGFKDYLARFGAGPLADNAQYWLGEAYYVTRDYDSALTAFGNIVRSRPESRKLADAQLKLGFTQFEMKRLGDARRTLTEVVQKFPGTDAARLAQERLQRIPANAP